MKNAIVTGGAGFIGSRLVERMAGKGWNVTVIDDLSTHDNPRFPDIDGVYFSYGKVQEHSLGLLDRAKPDVIIHLAGKVGPLGVLKFKGQIAKDTIDAAATVADWAERTGAMLIDTSTSEVYGNDLAQNSEEDKPVIQHHSARSEYAVSKLAAEHMLINRDIDVRVIRPFNIAGYGQRTEGGFVIPRFIRQAMSGESLTVYHPGSQQRSFTHVDDFIDGMAYVYRDGKSKEVYNIGNPHNTTTMIELAYQVIARLHSRSGLEIVNPLDLYGDDFKDAPDKIPLSTKLNELGWQPYRGTGEVVQDAIRYYLENHESTSLRIPYPEQAPSYDEDAILF